MALRNTVPTIARAVPWRLTGALTATLTATLAAVAAGCQVPQATISRRLTAHLALIDFTGLAPSREIDGVEVSASVPRTWDVFPPQHYSLFTHTQWRSPGHGTGVGVVHLHMPLPMSAKTLVWLAKSRYNEPKPTDAPADNSKPDGAKPDGAKPDGGKADGGKADGGKADEAKTPDARSADGKTADGKPADEKRKVPGGPGRLLREWSDPVGREWVEAENDKYHVRGYVVTCGFDAWVVYSGHKRSGVADPVDIDLGERSMDSVVPDPLAPPKPIVPAKPAVGKP